MKPLVLRSATWRIACSGFALILAGLWAGEAATRETGTLTVRVTGARNAHGSVGVAVFSSREGFPEDFSKAVRADWGTIDPVTLEAEVTFRGLARGQYAVAVLHDENNNGRLDRSLLGIPREGYGASNHAARRRRAPVFDDAQFSFDTESQTIEIRLVY